jgi:hypothetical protein
MNLSARCVQEILRKWMVFRYTSALLVSRSIIQPRAAAKETVFFIENYYKWISPLHKEQEWFGMWRQYDCDYLKFTHSQLQQCIHKGKRISSITTAGTSISEYLDEYLGVHLSHIIPYRNTPDPDAVSVVLDTLKLFHLNGPDGSLEAKLEKLLIVGKHEEHFVVNSVFLSSERKSHTHVARMIKYNTIVVPKIMEPKGYKMINTFEDMSAAFPYGHVPVVDRAHSTIKSDGGLSVDSIVCAHPVGDRLEFGCGRRARAGLGTRG